MSTKKIQILGSLGNKVYVQKDEPMNAPEGSVWIDLEEEYEETTLNADTLDGKHASDFAAISDFEALQAQVDNIKEIISAEVQNLLV